MRILNSNTNRVAVCKCLTACEYEDGDICCDADDKKYIICPRCSDIVYIKDTPAGINDSIDEIKFPDTFYHFGISPLSYICPNDEINKDIQELLNYMIDTDLDNEDTIISECGDTAIVCTKYDDCIQVIVAKNYYSALVNI